LRAKDDSGALAAFTRALSLRPQNPALRELVRSIRPEERYAAPYLYDAKHLAKLSPIAGEDVEVLADLAVVKVFANGLSSRTRQLVLRANSARGVDSARAQSVQYSPDQQVVKVERARIFKKDGTVLESKSKGERKLADGGTWRRWTAKDVAKLVPEPAMPGYSEMLAYVHVSTYRTWDDVGRFYWGLVKDQLRVTDDIRAAAQEAVKGIPVSDEL